MINAISYGVGYSGLPKLDQSRGTSVSGASVLLINMAMWVQLQWGHP